MEDVNIEKYLKSTESSRDELPTMREIDRALEQPGEANPKTVAYLQARPDLVDSIRRLKGDQNND